MFDISQIVNDCMYDEWRDCIRRCRRANVPWEKIKYGESDNEEGLLQYLDFQNRIGHIEPALTPAVWYQLVASSKSAEEEQQAIEERTKDSMLVDDSMDNNAQISTSMGSAWQLYRKHLKEDNGFSEHSLIEIEQSCFRILKRMSSDTTQFLSF